MSSKSNSDVPRERLTATHSSMRCEPLVARIDPLLRASTGASKIACTIKDSKASSGFTLDPPFFTRLTADAGLSQITKRLLLSELTSFGLAWLGDDIESDDRNPQANIENAFDELHRISPLQLDEPINVKSFENAAAIELQMVGVPFQTLANSRRARWAPGLPIDITDLKQLQKRVEVLRVVSGGRCPVGAAVCPGAVCEDVRFLIDCGFDFLTLLVDIQYGMSPLSSLRLAPLETSLEQSFKVIQDSGTNIKILVSANLCDGPQMFRCLQMGASAISIDAFIAHSKPKEVAQVKDTFGSVLSAYVPATAGSAMAWVKPAMSQLVEDLRDCAIYAGET